MSDEIIVHENTEFPICPSCGYEMKADEIPYTCGQYVWDAACKKCCVPFTSVKIVSYYTHHPVDKTKTGLSNP